MNQELLELYSDDLISTFRAATATGLAEMVHGTVSHDQLTRFLSASEYTSRALWLQVKPTVREVEQADTALIFDDTIQAKRWTDESELICWHVDHCQNRTVKGLNLLNALYDSGEVSIPVDVRLIHQLLRFCDVVTRRVKRASEVMKNQWLQEMCLRCVHNQLIFRSVLMDSWFAAKDHFALILSKDTHVVAVLKDHRRVALSQADKAQGTRRAGGFTATGGQTGRAGWTEGRRA